MGKGAPTPLTLETALSLRHGFCENEKGQGSLWVAVGRDFVRRMCMCQWLRCTSERTNELVNEHIGYPSWNETTTKEYYEHNYGGMLKYNVTSEGNCLLLLVSVTYLIAYPCEKTSVAP